MTLRGSLALIREFRQSFDTPIVLFTYANPVVRMDAGVFAREAKDGRRRRRAAARLPGRRGRAAPQALGRRRARSDIPDQPDNDRRADPAVGGARRRVSLRHLPAGRHRHARRAGRRRRAAAGQGAGAVSLPVAVGFGISRPAMVAQACRHADAAVVGSALVQEIATHADAPDLASRVESYVAWLKSEL